MVLIAIVTLLSLVASYPADLPAGESTPFRSSPGRSITVAVMMNGTGPFQLILDTGSSHSVISQELAQTLRAPLAARTVVATPIGDSTRLVVRLDHLELGPVIVSGALPSIIPQRAIDESGRIQGVIGQDVLGSRRFTIDFRRRVIVWHTASAPLPCNGPDLRLELEDGRFVVVLPQGGSVLRLVPDSGSAGVVLFQQDGHPRVPLGGAGRAELATLTRRATVQQGTLPELRVGAVKLRDVPVVLVQRAAAGIPSEDGLLPLDLFDAVTIDGPNRVMYVGRSRMR